MENMEDFKQQVANNLVYYRKKNKLTQLELAEKLSYSDKAISKWERGESLPDLFVLKNLADFYNISVDGFIHIEKNTKKDEKLEEKKVTNHKHLLIGLLSSGLVWFVATVIYVLLGLILGLNNKLWLAFIYAVPVNMIVGLVFNFVWGNRLHNFWAVSGLSWGLIIAIYLTFEMQNLWLLFIAAASFQILIILWFILQKILLAQSLKRQKNSQAIDEKLD